MIQYNFPTTILSGPGSLAELASRIKSLHKKVMVVTDQELVKLGLVKHLDVALEKEGIFFEHFDQTTPNPTDQDVEKATKMFKEGQYTGIIAFGGGSPIDLAKVIKLCATHEPPLSQYDDAKGGDRFIVNEMPPLYAVPTTAGTGSEVGRCSVIVMTETGKKTLFCHPEFLPDIAVLEPELTLGLPSFITAATGIDALTHCIEAYFAPMFHPMADGIALKGVQLILENLPSVCSDGNNMEARGAMQMAASMGAVAFQKGLGMIHSMAHPLSAKFGLHHGLANALLLPSGMRFLEESKHDQKDPVKIEELKVLFKKAGYLGDYLHEDCKALIQKVGIQLGLDHHGIKEKDVAFLSEQAFEDPCHATNMFPITVSDLKTILLQS